MTISDEKLGAFLDGELAPDEMAGLREHIASDEKLAARVEALAMVDRQVSSAIKQIDDTPIPKKIHDLANLLDQRKHVAVFPFWKRAHQQLQHYAIAAAALTAVVGFILGQSVNKDAPEAVTYWQAIAHALETRTGGKAQSLNHDATMIVNLTFFNQQGEYCRQFSVNTTDARKTQNIACRREGSWKLEASIPFEAPADKGDYQLASGPGPIDKLIDTMMKGQVLNAEQEKAAIDAAWSD